MAKPAYSLVYAILIALGLLVLVLFNRMIATDEAAPAAQASLQRNEATARETRDAVPEAPDRPTAQSEAPAAATAKDEEERK